KKAQQFYRDLLDRVKALPEVRSASVGRFVPFGMGGVVMNNVIVEGRTPARKEQAPSVLTNIVGTDYFRTIDIPVVRGPDFRERDDAGGPGAAIINEAMPRFCCPGEDPLGRKFRLYRGGPYLEVVGVARNAKYVFLGEQPRPYLYLPLAQNNSPGVTL